MADRDDKTGRFLPGNKASPGRPSRATEAEYLDAMSDAVSVEQWKKATAKMLALAIKGDVQAYKTLLPYFAGQPTQRLQISGELLQNLIGVLEGAGYDPNEVFERMIQRAGQRSLDG